jgi:hypothetical protein
MTDPRNTDPRRQDFRFDNPMRKRDQSVDRMWGWIAGLAVAVLIVFIVIVGWNASAPTTASNTSRPAAPAATTTGQGPASTPAPGQTMPKPKTIAPAGSTPPARTPDSGTQ